MKYLGPISDPKDIVNKEYVDNNASGHEELTQLEYDALSQAEKENGTVYFINDGDPEYTVVNDSVPIGAIQAYAGDTPPFGWLFCDGSAVSRTTYSDLFTAIGTTYGSGDGSTTFNVPDLKGRVLVGVGESSATGHTNHTLGQKDGEETHKLEVSEMPKHRHGIRLEYGASANPSYPPGSSYAQVTGTTTYGYNYTNNPIEYVGGDGSHTNMQPYTVANYIIKALDTVSSSMLKQLDPQSIIFDALYPVGSYYETSDSTFDPNTQWSGTWTSETITDDVIVEEGSNYIKWKSGLAECWGNISSSDWMGTITMPISFLNVNNYYTTATFQATNGQVQAVSTTKNTSQKFYYYCVTNHTVDWKAKGLWKTYTALTTKYNWHRIA